MNTRIPLVHVGTICCALVLGIPVSATAEPTVQFRWLQTDSKTGDSLVNALKANSLAADVLGAKIDQMVKGGKITEIAAFSKKCVSGGRFVSKPESDKIPLVMETEATIVESGLALRCVAEWTPKTPRGSGLLMINAETILSPQHWHLYGRWSDPKSDTLLLSCGSGLDAPLTAPTEKLKRAVVAHPPVVIHLDAEWRETNAADLAKVAQAPLDSRAKALVWLRGRSTLLAAATGTCKSGQKSRIDYLWGGKSEAELKAIAAKNEEATPKDAPPRPGVIVQWDVSAIGNGKPPMPTTPAVDGNVAKVDQQEFNLHVNATYVPLKSHGKTPGMIFDYQGSLRPDVPEFVAAKAESMRDQPAVVLVLTPWYDVSQ